MKNIYHIHQSSNSYWENHWTETDYYLCDSEEEYQRVLEKHKEERRKIEEDYQKERTYSKEWCFQRFLLSEEEEVHADEYYYAHEWCGKSFDAFGFCWSRELERSTHRKYYLKPDSVHNEKVSAAVGRFTGYGS